MKPIDFSEWSSEEYLIHVVVDDEEIHVTETNRDARARKKYGKDELNLER